MTQASRDVIEQALKLPPGERALVVAELVASLDGDEPADVVDAAWATEIERRILNMPPPGTPLPDAEEVFARIRKHLAERRRAR